jgi:hypothetical protein
MEVGMQFGNTHQDLLLILFITSAIVQLITFAEHIAILLQVMVLLQILLLLNMIKMDTHMPSEHLIPKYVSK